MPNAQPLSTFPSFSILFFHFPFCGVHSLSIIENSIICMFAILSFSHCDYHFKVYSLQCSLNNSMFQKLFSFQKHFLFYFSIHSYSLSSFRTQLVRNLKFLNGVATGCFNSRLTDKLIMHHITNIQ